VGQHDDSKQEVLYEVLRESQNESCNTQTAPDPAGMAPPTQVEKFNIKPRLTKPAPSSPGESVVEGQHLRTKQKGAVAPSQAPGSIPTPNPGSNMQRRPLKSNMILYTLNSNKKKENSKTYS